MIFLSDIFEKVKFPGSIANVLPLKTLVFNDTADKHQEYFFRISPKLGDF
jgi:hypothetical protein